MTGKYVFITNINESMYVHEVRGAIFVTWVAAVNSDQALKVPFDTAKEWLSLIMEMTNTPCKMSAPMEDCLVRR